MPHRLFALILALVVLAAGATIWIAAFFGVTSAGALALPALLVWALVRFITTRDAKR